MKKSMKNFLLRISFFALFLSLIFNANAQWSLTGNSGTEPDVSPFNFLGTIDLKPLLIKTNNVERIRIGQSGVITMGLGHEYSSNRLIVQNTYNTGMYNPGLTASFIQNQYSSTQTISPFVKVNILQKGPFTGEGYINGQQYVDNAWKIYFSVGRNGRTILGDHTSGATSFSGILLTVKGTTVIGDVLSVPGNYRLYVSGGILTEKLKVAVIGTAAWSDFVFNKSYRLMPLAEVEKFINENKHLPDVPSAEEMVANGLDVATMDAKLLQKIEELTLYMIEIKKEIDLLKKENMLLKSNE